MKIEHYMQDGANYQARVVLSILQEEVKNKQENITDKFSKWNNIHVSRFMNCREQGYTISVLKNMFSSSLEGITISFAENRSSDDIVIYSLNAVSSFNQPTLDFIFSKGYETKYFKYSE